MRNQQQPQPQPPLAPAAPGLSKSKSLDKSQPWRVHSLNHLTPPWLYEANYEWFWQQRRELARFLEVTVNQPQASFILILPKPHPLATSSSSSSSSSSSYSPLQPQLQTHSQPQSVGSVSYSRLEILELLGQLLTEFEADKVAAATSAEASPGTRWRWAARASGKRKLGLDLMLARAWKAYYCLADGTSTARALSRKTGVGCQYKSYLLNGLLAYMLVSAQSQPSKPGTAC